MVDCGLFQVIEIGRVVDVPEGIDLMEPDSKKGLECRVTRIWECARMQGHAALPWRAIRVGR